jgi:nitrogen-specific signal transduction histidine kinase
MNNKVNNIKYEGMESLVTAVIVCDKDLIIKYINPSTETLFEVSAKQAVNNNISIFFEDTNNFFKKVLKKLINKKIATRNMSTSSNASEKNNLCQLDCNCFD